MYHPHAGTRVTLPAQAAAPPGRSCVRRDLLAQQAVLVRGKQIDSSGCRMEFQLITQCASHVAALVDRGYTSMMATAASGCTPCRIQTSSTLAQALAGHAQIHARAQATCLLAGLLLAVDVDLGIRATAHQHHRKPGWAAGLRGHFRHLRRHLALPLRRDAFAVQQRRAVCGVTITGRLASQRLIWIS